MRKVRWCTTDKKSLRVNGGIRAAYVRLIDESNNQVGIVERKEALAKAHEIDLDLVEVAPMSDPPVCRIMNYGKYIYEQKRKFREGRKKTQHHTSTLKEIRLRPETDTHDLDIKIKHAREFLEKNHKVQFTMFFRGRQMLHQEKANEMFDQVIASLEEFSKVERSAKIANKRMILMLVPK